MGIISTQGFTFRLIANGTQLDIFQDEDIKLSNNVTGLFDIGILPSDFTRQLTLPGTKVNNAFFEHVYDISIDNPFLFATNIKVPAYFDFDSVYLSQGYLQLNKVNVRANKFIESYEVTIYGTLSSFGREVNRNFLTDLNSLQSYNHTSSFANISASWEGNLFNGDIIYPLADYGTGWRYTQGDVFFGLDDNEGAMTVQDFKPAIRIKPVLDAIFSEAGYTYSSSFFAQDWINNVYMICNNALKYPEYTGIDLETYGKIKISPFSGSNQTSLNIPDSTQTVLPWYNTQSDPSGLVGQNATYTIEKATALRGVLNLDIQLSGSLGGPAIELRVINTSSLAAVSTTTLVNFNQYFLNNTYAMFAEGANGQNKTYTLETEFNTAQISPGTYKFALYWYDQFSAPYTNFTFKLDPSDTPKSYLVINKQLQAADGRIMDIPSNMPYGVNGIKQIDFILGLQKKFNLVIYPDKTKTNQFIIETFNNWYNKGQRWDFNKYINLDETIEVIPANNLAVNKLNFGDTLDNDYVSQQFNKEANREYGKVYYIDTTNYFSQGEFNVKTTFGNGPLVKIDGTGLSGSVGGINPIPPASTAYVIGNAGWSNDYYACANTYYYPTPVYALESSPEFVTQLFTDAALTIPFNGGFSYWKWGYPYFYQKYSSYIDSSGNINSFSPC